MAPRPVSLLALLALLALSLACHGDRRRDASEIEAPPPPALEEYMGRRIARTMHSSGAEWLLRETREEEERPSRLFDALAVRPGWTVADFGCGNGFHTLELARRVGPAGRVLAVDIQPEMLVMLRQRAAAAGIANVETIEALSHDPRLPPAACDLILLVDVYHELGHPEETLAALRRALRPGGRVVLVEFRAEDPAVPIKELHKMSKVQIRAELAANGFELAEEFDDLPWQHVMFFRAAPALRAGAERARDQALKR